MKRFTFIVLAIGLVMLLFSGCSAETLAPTSAVTSPDNTPEVLIPTTAPNDAVSSKPAETDAFSE